MKIIKNRIFLVIITAIIFTCVGAYASATYNASQIMYTNSNNQEIFLSSALDELYVKANRVPEFGTARYSQHMQNAGSYTHQMNITKGKYIIAILYEYQLANKTTDIPSTNNSWANVLSLSCSSGTCLKTNISGRGYHPVAETSVFSNGYFIHSNVHLTMYYVEIKEDNDTLSTPLVLSWENSGLAEVVAIQAVPIS